MTRRLLIVDDEEAVRYALTQYFRTAGYLVDCASEPEEAQALVANIQYDAIVSDLRLSRAHGAEGLELVGYVRERCPWTRIVLLTGHGTPELEAEALRQGADRFLLKRQPLAVLAETVMSLTGAPED